jgi:hypothetical protein
VSFGGYEVGSPTNETISTNNSRVLCCIHSCVMACQNNAERLSPRSASVSYGAIKRTVRTGATVWQDQDMFLHRPPKWLISVSIQMSRKTKGASLAVSISEDIVSGILWRSTCSLLYTPDSHSKEQELRSPEPLLRTIWDQGADVVFHRIATRFLDVAESDTKWSAK